MGKNRLLSLREWNWCHFMYIFPFQSTHFKKYKKKRTQNCMLVHLFDQPQYYKQLRAFELEFVMLVSVVFQTLNL